VWGWWRYGLVGRQLNPSAVRVRVRVRARVRAKVRVARSNSAWVRA